MMILVVSNNITFASNPCRISYFGKQIVVCRYNYLKRIKKNRIYLEKDHEDSKYYDDNGKIEIYAKLKFIDFEYLANSIICQGNLVPLSYMIQPFYWDYCKC